MFAFKDIPDTNIVELKVDGRITQSDFDAVVRTTRTCGPRRYTELR